ncbi:hypothetical protein QTL97_08925 [Sporosarcina thermotolerans]|uniref:ABC transporter permease n=2 Tax=Sporosarcina thermotolerans TaxID=633404 RepID=A0AAW9AD36_9BACL|nr:hypothetical protein [Sporosarcina thermotolerans]MDW0117056.1 hypothetical protein [Sporosarcina thermotolerans]
MRIIFHECKKVLTSPILISLIIVFSAFNIFVIVSSSDHKEELKIINEIIETYGLDITDESLDEFKSDVQIDVAELNRMTASEFTSVYEFLDGLRYEDQEKYNDEQWEFIHRLQLKEMYLNMAKSIDESYKKIDIQKMAEVEIEKYGLSGKAAETFLNENEKFSERFEEMVNKGEQKRWFFAGKAYFMHTFLFKTVFLQIIIESLLLIVLTTALITTYEFENRTHLLTYSTKRGRKLMKNKLLSSLAMATTIVFLLFAITLGTFFAVFDYSHVWGTSISSAFNWEYNFPYVAWWDISVGAFLIGVIALVFVTLLLFSGLTFALSVTVKNSYITFFLMAALFVLIWLLPGFMPKSSILLFVSAYTLPTLILTVTSSFMGSSGLILFENFEWITISFWTVITLAVCFWSYKRFLKIDIQ